MAITYTTEVILTPAAVAPDVTASPNGVTSYFALEQRYAMRGMASNIGGYMARLLIDVVKSTGGRNRRGEHHNTYNVAGVALYDSDVAEALGRAIVAAERAIYPTQEEFLRLVITSIANNARRVKGNTASYPLNVNGLFAVPVGDKVADSNMVAVITRQAQGHRPSNAFYRNCITNSEFEAYQEDRTIPARFPVFVNALKALITEEGLRFAMPEDKATAANTVRFISDFFFAGLRVNDDERRRKKAGASLRDAVQKKINELGRAATYAKGAGWGVPPDVLRVATATALRNQAIEAYNSLPVADQARIVLPEIFNDPVLVAVG